MPWVWDQDTNKDSSQKLKQKMPDTEVSSAWFPQSETDF
jgi:hypothetical protein